MIKRALFGIVAMAAVSSTAFADDKGDLQAALKKLTDAPTYSWSTITENVGGFGGGGGAGAGGAPAPAPVPTTGMAEKAGYTVISAPPAAGRGGRGGRGGGPGGPGGPGAPGGGAPGAAGGAPAAPAAPAAAPTPPAPLQIVMKGDKTVVKVGDAWKTTEELTAAVAAPPAAPAAPAGGAPAGARPGAAPAAGGPGGGAPGGGFGGGGGGGGGGRGGRGGFGGSPEQQALAAINAVVIPTKMVADNAAKLDNVKKTADGYTATFPADTVKTMLAFAPAGGRGGAAPGGAAGAPAAPAVELTNPKGTLTVTLKDGVPSKIVSHMTGSMDFGGNAIDLDRTYTTDIKDVGTTKVTVPAEAKTKLDAAK